MENSTHNNDGLTLPSWMKDQELADIPKEKLLLLAKLVQNTAGLSQNELLLYLRKVSTQAAKDNIRFTSDELQRIIQTIKKHAAPAEQNVIDKVLKSKFQQ